MREHYAMTNLQSLLEIIKIIEAAESDELWVYVAITDNVTCEHCLRNEGKVFRVGRGGGYMALIDEFPDLIWESDVVVRPNIHYTLWGRETCRCKIFMASLAKLEDNQPVNPVMNEKPKIDFSLPKPEKPQTSPIDAFKVEPDQKELTDNQYVSFLDGLVSLGYISTTVYSAIIGRREKQQVTKEEVLSYLKTVSQKDSLWVKIQKLIQENQ